jgi:hypothetical protein
MISTKNLISDLTQVPRTWPFEYYLNLSEKLIGQDVKILSAFNSKDKVPSMCIYFDVKSDYYKFKDFSSGYQGDSISLVMYLFSLKDRYAAANKLIQDYQRYVTDNKIEHVLEIKAQDKFKVIDYEIRHWNNLDQTYWTQFHIGSKLLEHYNVSPLEYFKMERTNIDGTVTVFTTQRNYLYGYFRKDGTLYKIYLPRTPEKKFIKVQNYIQGADQLTYTKDYLVITSSLKDLMTFIKLGYKNAEAIAPDSENSMISESVIEKLKTRYKAICVLFDNDSPGIVAAEKYKSKYGFKYVVFPVEKDLSDAVKAIGVNAVKEQLIPYLKEALT